jgi:hypothetical protein
MAVLAFRVTVSVLAISTGQPSAKTASLRNYLPLSVTCDLQGMTPGLYIPTFAWVWVVHNTTPL